MKKIQSYRENNNFGYVSGEVVFRGNCNNILVISDKEKTELKDVQDSFVVFSRDSVYTSPISDFEKVFQKSEELLKGVKIVHHRPGKVREREDLSQKNLEELSKSLISYYNVESTQIKRIEKTGRPNGIFYITAKDSKKYVLKNYGRDPQKLEALAKITNLAPKIFPRILPTKNETYHLEMDDGYYGLEDFVCGENHIRDSDYFLKLGEAMARMHMTLNNLFGQNKEIRETLLSKTNSISDSNLASLWIDMTSKELWSTREEVKKLTKADLRIRVLSSSESYIHGDLNNANIIWTPTGLRFIDVETIKFSKRILDFEGSLLFQGNMMPPEYVPRSLDLLTKGYNKIVKEPLQEEESAVVKELMTYSLLKNFVIRNIRRGDKRNSLSRLKENISRVRDDKC